MSDKPHINEICDRIRQLRVEHAGARGKASFARELGISSSTYDYYEKGRIPPVDLLVRIAELTNADLRWLLTGQELGPGVPASHPAIARAAKLLADRPDFAGPLAAFVDLLSQAAGTFPAKADQKSGTPAPAAPKPDQSKAPTESGAAAGAEGPRLREIPPPAPPSRSERQGWIPILGRSAAGIPHFWRETGAGDSGATALADVVARMRPRRARHFRQACATGELAANGTSAQLVLLDSPEPPGTAEFVIAEHISRRYDVVFAVRIDGASMAPEIRHGDVVILSPSCPAEQGKPAVVQLADQIGVTCKLLRIEGDRVHLIPINEDFAPTEHPLGELAWALKVIARVRPA